MKITAEVRAIAPNGCTVRFDCIKRAGPMLAPYRDGWWLTITAPGSSRPVAEAWVGHDLDAAHAGQVLAEEVRELPAEYRFDVAALVPVEVADAGEGWRGSPDVPRFGEDGEA